MMPCVYNAICKRQSKYEMSNQWVGSKSVGSIGPSIPDELPCTAFGLFRGWPPGGPRQVAIILSNMICGKIALPNARPESKGLPSWYGQDSLQVCGPRTASVEENHY